MSGSEEISFEERRDAASLETLTKARALHDLLDQKNTFTAQDLAATVAIEAHRIRTTPAAKLLLEADEPDKAREAFSSSTTRMVKALAELTATEFTDEQLRLASVRAQRMLIGAVDVAQAYHERGVQFTRTGEDTVLYSNDPVRFVLDRATQVHADPSQKRTLLKEYGPANLIKLIQDKSKPNFDAPGARTFTAELDNAIGAQIQISEQGTITQ